MIVAATASFCPPHHWQASPQVGDLTMKMMTCLVILLSGRVSKREPEIWNRRRVGKASWYWIRMKGTTVNSWWYLYECTAPASPGPALQIPALQRPHPGSSDPWARSTALPAWIPGRAAVRTFPQAQARGQGRHGARRFCFPAVRDWWPAFVASSALCCLFPNVWKHSPQTFCLVL